MVLLMLWNLINFGNKEQREVGSVTEMWEVFNTVFRQRDFEEKYYEGKECTCTRVKRPEEKENDR